MLAFLQIASGVIVEQPPLVVSSPTILYHEYYMYGSGNVTKWMYSLVLELMGSAKGDGESYIRVNYTVSRVHEHLYGRGELEVGVGGRVDA